jgi:hypothetical protein
MTNIGLLQKCTFGIIILLPANTGLEADEVNIGLKQVISALFKSKIALPLTIQ